MRISDWSSDVCSSDRQQLTADLPEVQLAGTLFNPPKLRLRGTASFASGGFRMSSSLNVTGKLTDRRFTSESRISPSATLDMSVGYDVITREGRDPGLTIALTIDRKRVGSGKSVSVRVDLGGLRILKKKTNNQRNK